MPAYFIAVLLAFVVWSVLFLLNKNTRREMVVIGTVLSPFVVLDVLTTPTYWKPITAFNLPVGVEGFLFTFFITGIAAVIYEIIFKKRYRGSTLHISLCIAFIVPALITSFAIYFLKLNIIYLFILGFTLMAVFELIKRRDLLWNSIFSSLLFGIVYIVTFSLWLYLSPQSLMWWNAQELTNISIGIVPLEEVLFSLSLGLFVGPLYEYLTVGKLLSPVTKNKRPTKKRLKR